MNTRYISAFGKIVLVGLAVLLSMGSAQASPSGSFVARSTLKPLNVAPQTAVVVQERVVRASAPVSVSKPVEATTASPGGLTGSVGYSRAGGNCVNEPGVNNPRTGNPINWAVTSFTPAIGKTVLFTWNHVGVVTGVWSNGDVEVRHQNCGGCPHRYSPSMIRGYR